MLDPIIPELDLDRLHTATEIIASGAYRHRGIGVSYAYLHLLMGEVYLADPYSVILYITDTKAMAEDFARQFRDHLHHFDPAAVRYSTRSQVEFTYGPRIIFCGVDNRYAQLCGVSCDRIYIDISERCWKSLEKQDMLHELQTDLAVCLKPDGEMI